MGGITGPDPEYDNNSDGGPFVCVPHLSAVPCRYCEKEETKIERKETIGEK